MPHRLTLEQAADFLNLDVAELNSLAVQGEIPCSRQGKRLFFDQDELDSWCSQQIIDFHSDKPQKLKKQSERKRTPRPKKTEATENTPLYSLCQESLVSTDIQAKSMPAVLKELVKLANKSGYLYNPQDLYDELHAREEESPTAIGFGVAIPHPRKRLEIPLFDESFVCLARLDNPVFFGAEYGNQKTDIFFLVCCLDSELHLNIIARICQLCQETSLIHDLRDAESPSEMLRILTDIDLNPQAFPPRKE